MTPSVHITETMLSSVLLQLIVIIAAARIMHTLFRRLGQPGVVGEIVAGLLLGPSLLGHVFPALSEAIFGTGPQPTISVLSQIGLILLMFQIGSEFAFHRLQAPRLRAIALVVAISSVSVPFLAGFVVGQMSAATLAPTIDANIFSLFCGIAMAITAVPILGRILVQYDLADSNVGIIAIGAAALNDVAGWVLLACISAYATAQLSIPYIVAHLGGLLMLAACLRQFGAPVADWLMARFAVNEGRLPINLVAIMIVLMFALALITQALGIFAIFGGLAAGWMVHRHRAFVDAWRAQVGQFVIVFFLPIFFTYTGLKTDLGAISMQQLPWLVAICLVAILAKLVPVYIAARACGLSQHDSLTLGTLMNTRGLMELIVLNVGLELGFMSDAMFTMLVVMAIVTTLMAGPVLRLLLRAAVPSNGQSVRTGDAGMKEVA